MRKVSTAIKTQAFIYDFTVDTGAIGTYATGISIPVTAIILETTLRCQVATAGGAGGTFDLYWNGNNAFCSFGPVQAIGSIGFPDLYVSGNVSPALTMHIATNTITAGKFIWMIHYIDSSNR